MKKPNDWTEARFQFGLKVVEQASTLSRKIQADGAGAHQKLDSSPVTVADLSVQALVAFLLSKEFPEDQLIAEESAEQLSSDVELMSQVISYLTPEIGSRSADEILECFNAPRSGSENSLTWILDPIDGTKGFLRGDQFAVALACQEADSQLLFGLLGCPRLALSGAGKGEGAIGAAFRGRGAWQKSLGDSPWQSVRVSQIRDAQGIRLLRSFEASHTNESQIESFVSENGIEAEPVRMDSQAKYLLLARGDAEAVIRCLSPKYPDYKEKIWDQAAGCILAQEAGGEVVDLFGKPLDFSKGIRLTENTGVVASSGALKNLNWEPLRACPV